MREFFRADRRHPRLHVELPDGTRLDDVYFAIVANTDPWTYVGNRPLHPTPEADFDTGLAVYARRRMGTAGHAVQHGPAVRRPPARRPPRRVRAHDLDDLTVLADEPLPFQVDGDSLGLREKLVFTSAPHARSHVL